MVTLLCFSNPKFAMANALLQQSARAFGITKIIHKQDKDFRNTNFFKAHADITSEPFGAGFYCWKPFYILEQLEQLAEGDILMYVDSGHTFTSSPAPLIALADKNPVLLFQNYQGYHFFSAIGIPFSKENCYVESNSCKFWCKHDAFRLMNTYTEEARNAWTVDASIMLFRKNNESVAFVRQWLDCCKDRRLISWDDNEDGAANWPGFRFHVYDQSILSLLAHKHQLPLFRCPSQFGNHFKPLGFRQLREFLLLPYAEALSNSDYDTITWHHRYKDKGAWWRWKSFLHWELHHINSKWLHNRFNILNRLLGNPPVTTL